MQKIRELIKKNIRWIILLISSILFIKILEDLFENEINQFDTIIYHTISYFISNTLTMIVKIITNIGSAPVVLSITLISILLLKNRKIAVCIVSNLVMITTLNQLLKRIIARPRPTQFRLIDESGYSFPSGHSMVSMAFYGLFIYIAYKKIKNEKLRNLVCVLLSFIILAIGISRIYLGVHYPSDVLAGFFISLAYLALFTNVVKKYIEEKD